MHTNSFDFDQIFCKVIASCLSRSSSNPAAGYRLAPQVMVDRSLAAAATDNQLLLRAYAYVRTRCADSMQLGMRGRCRQPRVNLHWMTKEREREREREKKVGHSRTRTSERGVREKIYARTQRRVRYGEFRETDGQSDGKVRFIFPLLFCSRRFSGLPRPQPSICQFYHVRFQLTNGCVRQV